MKYIISESQFNRLLHIYQKFLDDYAAYGLCKLMVDYDDTNDKFVINIFFSRKISIEEGIRFNKISKKITNSVGQKFLDYTGEKPWLYSHYTDC